MFHRLSIGVAFALILGACAPALAESVLDIGVLVQWGRGTWNSNEHAGSVRVTPNGDGTYTVKVYAYVPGEFSAMWNMVMDPDPFLYGLFSFTNQSASTGTFQVVVDLPGVDLPVATEMSGSIAGTVLDRNGDGATLSAPAGGAVYTAMIDGNDQQTLLQHAYSCSAGSYAANAFGPASFSNVAGPPVTQSLAIMHNFTLTAGDSTTMSSSFVVTPEPTAALLLATALGAVLVRGRNRR